MSVVELKPKREGVIAFPFWTRRRVSGPVARVNRPMFECSSKLGRVCRGERRSMWRSNDFARAESASGPAALGIGFVRTIEAEEDS